MTRKKSLSNEERKKAYWKRKRDLLLRKILPIRSTQENKEAFVDKTNRSIEQLRERVEASLESLSLKEREILRKRFGAS